MTVPPRAVNKEVFRLARELARAAERARVADHAVRAAQDRAEEAQRAWEAAFSAFHAARARATEEERPIGA